MMAFLMFLGLLSLILINVPIAIALGVVAMTAMVFHSGMESLLSAAITMFSSANVRARCHRSCSTLPEAARATRFQPMSENSYQNAA